MPYTDNDINDKNVSYTNKDFLGLKKALVEYAKAYFPNTYRDFNETSPGMMLIEMSAYVGDVLSFYVDQQFKEMMLPLSEERRNIINLAQTLGYKVKSVNSSFVDLNFTQTVGVNSTDDGTIVPNYNDAVTLESGIKVSSKTDANIIFETLAPIDFKASSSIDPDPIPSGVDSDNLTNEYTLTRKVRAIGGNRKTKIFTVGQPSKFLELKVPDKNVIEIISITDSSDNEWSEVDYLAQDKVRIDTFYSGSMRTTAYSLSDASIGSVPVPFTLEYKKVSKRFITRTNEDNTTSIIFGNGVMRNGQELGQEFLDLQQVGLTIPGDPGNYTFGPDNIDIGLGDSQSTLGETPFNTTLTVVYRVGNGIKSNLGSDIITNIDSSTLTVNVSGKNLLTTNPNPSFGGSDQDSVEEIKHKALAFFTAQNRCVTREDYEARVLNMPAKFGQVSKVYTNRGDNLITIEEETDPNLVNIYMLSYDKNKNLKVVKNESDSILHPLKQNVINYLDHYKMLTDDINITDGYIINFGVLFDVISTRSANKQEVKIRCINKIKEYFNIDKMQFHQPIYTSDLIYELSGIKGVRAVNLVQITQNFDLYDYTYEWGGKPLYCNDTENTIIGQCNELGAGSQYGWKYDFEQFYNPSGVGYQSNGIILPSVTPAVFELKNPNQNIIGVVH